MPPRKLKQGERRRCANACDTCKRRKERCDGRQPCARCLTRGVEADCSFVPQSAQTRKTRNVRMDNIDPILREPSQRHSQSSLSPVTSSIEVLDQTQPRLESRLRHDLGRGNLFSCATSLQLSQLVQDPQGKFVFIGDAANLSFLQIVRRLVRKSVGPCAFTEDALQHLMFEAKSSRTSNWITDIMSDRPARPDLKKARYLLSWYIHSTCLLNFFEEGELGESLTSWYQTSPDELGNETSAVVFFLIFAIGAQTCPENMDQEAEEYFNYARFLITSNFMDDISIFAVQANILITSYLLSASRRNAAFMYLGSAVRAAYALGIQRHDINRTFKQSDYVLRERLWKVLRMLDLFMSASLGRPLSTHETRDTGFDENYSAANDLCAIFEDILTNIYSQRKVASTDLARISGHHRKWAAKVALATDSTKPPEVIKTADDHETSSNGLCYLKEAYYWTIMLLARPSLIQITSKHLSKATHDLTPFEPPGAATELNQVLAYSCVDSAVRTADLLRTIGCDSRQTPKRLPFVVNGLFAAALVLGMAYFSDLDHIFPLGKSLLAVRSLIGRFSAHDPIARNTLQTIDNLQIACKIYVDDRARRKMERQSLLVQNLFGTVHDWSGTETPAPQNNATGPISISPQDCSEFRQTEQVIDNWTISQPAGGLEAEIRNSIPQEALGAFSFPTPTPSSFESLSACFPMFADMDMNCFDTGGNLGPDNLLFEI
ncbi:transcriptional regulatory [Fusarium beomiforme]|uniref:Transcriptional regulatory n=1 Tax=Fusarium beomiforme TaxID=44412 RepID=A0A9P5AI75_9HYPO|nr:transcriptional regulatory [Fusarium beomiforme]